VGDGDREPEAAWVEGSLSGRSAGVQITGLDDGPLAVALAGDALNLSRG